MNKIRAFCSIVKDAWVVNPTLVFFFFVLLGIMVYVVVISALALNIPALCGWLLAMGYYIEAKWKVVFRG